MEKENKLHTVQDLIDDLTKYCDPKSEISISIGGADSNTYPFEIHRLKNRVYIVPVAE